MRSLFKILIVVMVIFLTSCLPDFVSPLTSLSKITKDPRLVGSWIAHDPDNGKKQLINISEISGQWYKIRGLEPKKKKTATSKPETGKLKVSKVKGQWYLNYTDDTMKSYLLLRYKITGKSKMTVWFSSEDAFEDLMNKGKIKGKKEGKFFKVFHVTSNSQELKQVLMKNDPGLLFDQSMEFTRK